MVDSVMREWMQLLRWEIDLEGEELDEIMETLLRGRRVHSVEGPHLRQRAIDGLITNFEHVGLETNTKKTQAMTCTPGNIPLQLPTKSFQRMHTRRTPAADWDARTVTCRECGKDMRVSSLGRHLADLHEI
jgi:RNase P subunit RPR2